MSMTVVVGIRCRGEFLEFGVVLLLLRGGGNHGRCVIVVLLFVHHRSSGHFLTTTTKIRCNVLFIACPNIYHFWGVGFRLFRRLSSPISPGAAPIPSSSGVPSKPRRSKDPKTDTLVSNKDCYRQKSTQRN